MWNPLGQDSPYQQPNQQYGMQQPRPLRPSQGYPQQANVAMPQQGYSQLPPMMPFGPQAVGGRYPMSSPMPQQPQPSYELPDEGLVAPGRGLMGRPPQQFTGHPALRPTFGQGPLTR